MFSSKDSSFSYSEWILLLLSRIVVDAKGVKSTVCSSCCALPRLDPFGQVFVKMAKANSKKRCIDWERDNVQDVDVIDPKKLAGGF